MKKLILLIFLLSSFSCIELTDTQIKKYNEMMLAAQNVSKLGSRSFGFFDKSLYMSYSTDLNHFNLSFWYNENNACSLKLETNYFLVQPNNKESNYEKNNGVFLYERIQF